MTFLVDANVFIDFQKSNLLSELVQVSHSVKVAIAEQVFEELTFPKKEDSEKRKGEKRVALSSLRQSQLDIIEIGPETAEAKLMETLLAPLKTLKEKDRGEAASIAIASCSSELVFVTGDNTAIVWALNELFGTGERVMRVPVFIRKLYECGALSAIAVKGVAERAASHGQIPTWWTSWLAAL